MAKKTLKCFKCKQDILREELVAYASPNAKILHNYCPKCLEEKQANDLLRQTLTDEVLEQKFIEKWNGQLPTTYAGDDILKMFNLKQEDL